MSCQPFEFYYPNGMRQRVSFEEYVALEVEHYYVPRMIEKVRRDSDLMAGLAVAVGPTLTGRAYIHHWTEPV